jgi:hypothetical protein
MPERCAGGAAGARPAAQPLLGRQFGWPAPGVRDRLAVCRRRAAPVPHQSAAPCDTHAASVWAARAARASAPNARAQAAVPRVGDARPDWQVVRALSEVVGAPLPYDSDEGVRARLAELAPHLGRVAATERPLWLNGEYFKARAAAAAPRPCQRPGLRADGPAEKKRCTAGAAFSAPGWAVCSPWPRFVGCGGWPGAGAAAQRALCVGRAPRGAQRGGVRAGVCGPRGQEGGRGQGAVREQRGQLLPDGRHLAHLRRDGQVRAGQGQHAPRLAVRRRGQLVGRGARGAARARRLGEGAPSEPLLVSARVAGAGRAYAGRGAEARPPGVLEGGGVCSLVQMTERRRRPVDGSARVCSAPHLCAPFREEVRLQAKK